MGSAKCHARLGAHNGVSSLLFHVVAGVEAMEKYSIEDVDGGRAYCHKNWRRDCPGSSGSAGLSHRTTNRNTRHVEECRGTLNVTCGGKLEERIPNAQDTGRGGERMAVSE